MSDTSQEKRAQRRRRIINEMHQLRAELALWDRRHKTSLAKVVGEMSEFEKRIGRLDQVLQNMRIGVLGQLMREPLFGRELGRRYAESLFQDSVDDARTTLAAIHGELASRLDDRDIAGTYAFTERAVELRGLLERAHAALPEFKAARRKPVGRKPADRKPAGRKAAGRKRATSRRGDSRRRRR